MPQIASFRKRNKGAPGDSLIGTRISSGAEIRSCARSALLSLRSRNRARSAALALSGNPLAPRKLRTGIPKIIRSRLRRRPFVTVQAPRNQYRRFPPPTTKSRRAPCPREPADRTTWPMSWMGSPGSGVRCSESAEDVRGRIRQRFNRNRLGGCVLILAAVGFPKANILREPWEPREPPLDFKDDYGFDRPRIGTTRGRSKKRRSRPRRYPRP